MAEAVVGCDVRREVVPHPVALGLHVPLGFRVHPHVERHALGDREPEPVESSVLRRAVGEQPDRGQAQIGEDLGADAVLARVDREPEVEVGVDRVAHRRPAARRRAACG